jgi:hypothetical protein
MEKNQVLIIIHLFIIFIDNFIQSIFNSISSTTIISNLPHYYYDYLFRDYSYLYYYFDDDFALFSF